MAGIAGCGVSPSTLFFPSRCPEAAGLEEGKGNHCHQAMSVQPGPWSAFEVIKTEFFLELLMGLAKRCFASEPRFRCVFGPNI